MLEPGWVAEMNAEVLQWAEDYAEWRERAIAAGHFPDVVCRERRGKRMSVGHYVIVRVGNPVTDEWTNAGVLLYDGTGRLTESRMDTQERAVRRGDWKAAWSFEDLSGYATGVSTLDDVRQRRLSMAHGMSVIQMTAPRATVLNSYTMEQIWDEFIGK